MVKCVNNLRYLGVKSEVPLPMGRWSPRGGSETHPLSATMNRNEVYDLIHRAQLAILRIGSKRELNTMKIAHIGQRSQRIEPKKGC